MSSVLGVIDFSAQVPTVRQLTAPSVDVCLLNTPGCSFIKQNTALSVLSASGGHESNYNIPHLPSARIHQRPRTLHFSITVLGTSSACRPLSFACICDQFTSLKPHQIMTNFVPDLNWMFCFSVYAVDPGMPSQVDNGIVDGPGLHLIFLTLVIISLIYCSANEFCLVIWPN